MLGIPISTSRPTSKRTLPLPRWDWQNQPINITTSAKTLPDRGFADSRKTSEKASSDVWSKR
ncbi:hypothetical protein Csa_015855 [Cucumis sativus]|uniref:Uncharacterized protein n=1 Tax=Cucumis sativus TaxID=3659 RepID=A0A0A0K8D6_CUCSA|nr:hypothetical protein Csa_015855 [Cucumis sativus]